MSESCHLVWTLDIEQRSLVSELNWAASRPRPEVVSAVAKSGWGSTRADARTRQCQTQDVVPALVVHSELVVASEHCVAKLV